MAEVVAIMTGAIQVTDGRSVVTDQDAAKAIGL
jgi:fructose transport system ATP-binding protein